MADWHIVEMYVDGPEDKLTKFGETEIDPFINNTQSTEYRITVDEWLVNMVVPMFEGTPAQLFARLEVAYDDGERWVKAMREKYPTLTIEALIQTWENI